MGTGIMICGLNGTGKSTLGRALAEKLKFHFIDNEELYFSKTDSDYAYASSRTRKEAEELLHARVREHENFVYAAVKGDYGEDILSFYKYAVFIEVPEDIRLWRVKNRSFQKFGSRIMPGGDLYEREKKFFDMVKARTEGDVRDWVRSLGCPVIGIDGTKPVEENVDAIVKWIRGEFQILDAGRNLW